MTRLEEIGKQIKELREEANTIKESHQKSLYNVDRTIKYFMFDDVRDVVITEEGTYDCCILSHLTHGNYKEKDAYLFYDKNGDPWGSAIPFEGKVKVLFDKIVEANKEFSAFLKKQQDSWEEE